MKFELRIWPVLGVLTIMSMNCAEASSTCDSVTWKDWRPLVQRKDAVEQTDHTPSLAWHSVALLLDPGKVTRQAVADCIADFVENKTDHVIRNVLWPIADDYREDLIPPHDALTHFHSVGGEAPMREGPLYVGVGRYFETTTPYVAALKPSEIATTNGKRELVSGIEFVDSRFGERVKLQFMSTVTSLAGEGHEFDYSVRTSAFNKGSMKYVVYWYVPLTDDFQRLRINLESPITAATGEIARYSIASTAPAGWRDR